VGKQDYAYIPMAASHINTSTIFTCMGRFWGGPVSRQPE